MQAVAGPRFPRRGSGDWRTPRELAQAIQFYLRVRCTIDGAATEESAICPRWLERVPEQKPLKGDIIWLNPPWARIRPWAEQIVRWLRTDGAAAVVALLPASTDTVWFRMLWASHHLRRVLFITPRVAYVHSDGEQKRSPTVGSMVLYLERELSPKKPRVDLVYWTGEALLDAAEMGDELRRIRWSYTQ